MKHLVKKKQRTSLSLSAVVSSQLGICPFVTINIFLTQDAYFITDLMEYLFDKLNNLDAYFITNLIEDV